MELAEQILGYALGGLGALIGLVWFMLRLYIKNEMHELKDYLVEEFDKLNSIFENKETATVKYIQHGERISALERKNGRH